MYDKTMDDGFTMEEIMVVLRENGAISESAYAAGRDDHLDYFILVGAAQDTNGHGERHRARRIPLRS